MKDNMYFESAGNSDIGKQRQHNEDALTASDALGLYAVADGMGGHSYGDIASRVTIETLQNEIEYHFGTNDKSQNQEGCYQAIFNAIENCNKLLVQKNVENNSTAGEGMGTTLVGAYFLKSSKQVIIFNVGDSRIYRLRGGVLQQITRDQTMYQEWLDAGMQGDAPAKNILVNAVGVVEELVPDIKLEPVLNDDVYVVCSDGLSGLVDDSTLREYMRVNGESSSMEICNTLIDIANQNGGNDNITVIIIRVQIQSADRSTAECDMDATLERLQYV